METSKHLLAKIGQYCLIFNDEWKVLVLERARSKQWTLPGGRLNEGEGWDAALLREIKEETNLDVTDFKIIGNNVVTDPYQTKYCTYFVTRVSNIDTLKIWEEHSSLRWIHPKEPWNIPFEDGIGEIISKYGDCG